MSVPAVAPGWTMAVLVGAQLLYTWADLIARSHMRQGGFTIVNLVSWWFALYFTIRLVATFGQLFVFASMELGRSSALFGAVAIILGNGLGFLLLGEVLGTAQYLAVSLVVVAFLVLWAAGR